MVLRTHTSPVQIRSLLTRPLPLYVVSPGRVYRNEASDATHLAAFYQIEGLAVDEGLTMADLRGAIQAFVDALFGAGLRTRLRPDYFPFTEPSADVSMECHVCRGASVKPGADPCRTCRSMGWIEIAGCGMVNPRVLVACGIDPDRYSGFAFGLGVERALMLAHGIGDIKDTTDGDVRFSRAFGMELSAMKVPLSWLREYAPIPEPADPADIARRLTAAGLEVESHEPVGDIDGLIVAQVQAIEELAEFKKPIRYCRVATSEADLAADPQSLRGVICGATNFAVGDRVVLVLPGSVLPGGFEIAARKTYGRVSEGMICAPDELGVGEDHAGIIVLPPDTPLGADFTAYAGLRDEVFEIAVTPDRGYAVSIRGVARELASAYGVPFSDPADPEPADLALLGSLTEIGADVYPASIADPTACDRFVLREVRGFSPSARTPVWMWVRLARCGVRSVSLAVDVTNYLMLELGQPLHAFDRSKLTGPDRGPPRGGGGDAGDPRPRGPHPAPRRHPHHRLLRADLDGRHHGRAGHRDRRRLHRPGDRGRALLRRRHREDVAAAPAALRGVLPVRAGRGPRAAAGRHRPRGVAAGLAGRRRGRARLHARAGASRAGDDLDGGRLSRRGGWRRLRARRRSSGAWKRSAAR